MAVYRHRREHVVKPMQLATAALDKGRAVRERREELIKKTAEGDPTAIFKLDSIADIARIAARLDASAQEAAEGGQHTSHAALAGQLRRGLEVRSKLGGHDRPLPAEAGRQTLSVVIRFASTGERVAIETTAVAPEPTTIDAVPCEPAMEG
jgi:hypothetical protein